MSFKPSPIMSTSVQAQRQEIINTAQGKRQTPKPTHSKQLHSASTSQFSLPEGWMVEERPRPSNPDHIDRYYYEPYTGRKFRSLLSVQRHLAGETEGTVPARRKISKNKNTTFAESGAGQQLSSVRTANFLLEDAYPTIPKSTLKSGTGEREVFGGSSRKPAYKRSSKEERLKNIQLEEPAKLTIKGPSMVAEKDVTTPRWLKDTYQPKLVIKGPIVPAEKEIAPTWLRTSKLYEKPIKRDLQKTNKGNNSKSPAHNLPGPPPEKVTWVPSEFGGFWKPFVDGSAVMDSDKLKWSEAFVLSTRP
ncbi:unnamed protein product [Sphenostylis stenocarpa]|uniref:MBD domain-containing protein n=1 Tax=Sphenostylis stenocarpa TaxID=92480 RepID=A0AA86SI87_9FABA|nr:unnamed protein product [Sphenostylis stenocarpa]